MGTTRLLLYQGAILHLGERQLSSLTENRESRRVLDAVWDTGAVDYVLEQGLWNFAMRTIQLDYSPSVEPGFGYSRAFDKPTDWLRTAALCEDPYFKSPLNQYTDEASFWFADLQTIYVRYVSNDDSYGADLSRWPQTFAKYVEAYLGWVAAGRLTQSDERIAKIERAMTKAVKTARSHDAMNDPAQFPPRGSWVRARGGSRGGNDRGNPGSLIG